MKLKPCSTKGTKDLTRPKALKCVDMMCIRFLQLSVSFTVLWL